MESKNRYGGVHPYVLWCVRKFTRMLIQKSPRFLKEDYEDIEQELVMYFLSEEPKIDASRSDWKLHVFMILKKAAFRMQLREEAQKRGGRERPLSFYLTPDGGGQESPEMQDVLPSEQGLWGDNFFAWNHLNTEVRADIQKFIEGLPPRYQQLCEWLKEKLISEIAQDTHIPRTTLSSAVGVLRRKMREAGLEIYLNPASSVSGAFVKPSPERPKTTKETMDEKKTAPGISEDLQHAPGSVEGDQPVQVAEAVGGGDRRKPQGGAGASVAGRDYPAADGQVTEGPAPNVVTLRVDYRQQTTEMKERLLHDLPAVLKHLLPNGVTRHGKFYVGDVQGNRGESMVVELVGPKAGLWHDFATGDGGDILSLWAAVRGINAQADFPRLMQDIREWLGVMPPVRDIKPEVKTRPSQKVRNDKGPVTGRWDYLSATGELLCTVYRFDPPGQRKVYQPWDVMQGKMAWPEAPRPLFNLPGLLVAPRVVLAEGEKAAHALNGAGICATTAMNGANAVIEKTDWAPLAGKHVLIWPDNDEEGRNYATRAASAIAKAVAAKVEILQPPAGRPDKWDGADAVAEGLDIERFLATAERMVIKEEPKQPEVLPSFSFGELVADTSPMPADIIGPRVLTPGGLLVFGGAPKVGKSDFLISMLAYMAAGLPFLGLVPPRPLRVFYLQAEIQYDYLRERVKGIGLPSDAMGLLSENFYITPQVRMLLDEAGVKRVAEAIRQRFPDAAPDIIAIDPIRNVFDGGPEGMGENDNNAMLFFLQERVEALRQMVSPAAGVILTHHTRKAGKRQVEEDPFQSFSGAGSLRSFYTTGMLLLRPDENAPERRLLFELRNGPEIKDKAIGKEAGVWRELDVAPTRLVMKEYGSRQDAERSRRQDVIVKLIAQEAARGRVYIAQQFAEAFENKHGLGGEKTIRNRIDVLATQGHIQFFKRAEAYGIPKLSRTRFGYLCVSGMYLGSPNQPVYPSHRKDPATGDAIEVENPYIWQADEVDS